MAAPQQRPQQQAKLVLYHIPGDGDDADTPNAYPILKPSGAPTVREVRAKFPLPGTYHFRFKMKWGESSSSAVWMDVTNEDAQVPLWDGKIIAKVTRISWEGGSQASQPRQATAPIQQGVSPQASPQRPAPQGQPAAAAAPKPQQQQQQQPPPPAAAQQNMLSFDDHFGGGGSPAAAPSAKPPPPASSNVMDDPLGFGSMTGGPGTSKKDDFDMLFS